MFNVSLLQQFEKMKLTVSFDSSFEHYCFLLAELSYTNIILKSYIHCKEKLKKGDKSRSISYKNTLTPAKQLSNDFPFTKSLK